MKQSIRLMIFLVLPFGMSGCAGLLDSDEPAERTYWLEPFVVQNQSESEDSLRTLSVSVSAAPGLDTDRLLILGPESRLNHYAAARWPDHFPEVLESLLRTTLESTQRYSRVVAGPTGISSDLKLELEVRESYTAIKTSESAPVVRIVLRGYVSCANTDSVIMLASDAGIDDNHLSKIVAGYQRALNDVSEQLVDKLDASCDAADAATG